MNNNEKYNSENLIIIWLMTKSIRVRIIKVIITVFVSELYINISKSRRDIANYKCEWSYMYSPI